MPSVFTFPNNDDCKGNHSLCRGFQERWQTLGFASPAKPDRRRKVPELLFRQFAFGKPINQNLILIDRLRIKDSGAAPPSSP